MQPRHPCHLAIAVAAALAVLFTQQFLSVHELQHIGETDSSHCPYAPLTAAAGGAVLQAPPTLTPPPVAAVSYPIPLTRGSWVAVVPQQARAPPQA